MGLPYVVLAVALTVLGCESSQEREVRERAAARAGADAAADIAATAATIPSTGLWDEPHLLDRLLRSGVAPRAIENPPKLAPWMEVEPIALHAGGGRVYVWIYPDSTARRAVTDGLNPDTGTPAGETVPYSIPMVFVTQNNLAAAIFEGSVVNHERIMLALEAGLPVSR